MKEEDKFDKVEKMCYNKYVFGKDRMHYIIILRNWNPDSLTYTSQRATHPERGGTGKRRDQALHIPPKIIMGCGGNR